MTDDLPLLDLPILPRDARLREPAQPIPAWLLENCLYCRTRTWPMGRNAAGQRREQCLHCGQRYTVKGQRAGDEDEDDDDIDTE